MDYFLTDMPMPQEKTIIENTIKDRYFLLIEFTVGEDKISVVVTRAWRFRKERLRPLGFSLIRASKMQRIDDSEITLEDGKDPWVNVATIEKVRLREFLKDAQHCFGSTPVRFKTHVMSDDADEILAITNLIESTGWKRM